MAHALLSIGVLTLAWLVLCPRGRVPLLAVSFLLARQFPMRLFSRTERWSSRLHQRLVSLCLADDAVLMETYRHRLHSIKGGLGQHAVGPGRGRRATLGLFKKRPRGRKFRDVKPLSKVSSEDRLFAGHDIHSSSGPQAATRASEFW